MGVEEGGKETSVESGRGRVRWWWRESVRERGRTGQAEWRAKSKGVKRGDKREES